MANLEQKLEQFSKINVDPAVELLREIANEKMPVYASRMVIMSQEEFESNREDSVLDKLTATWRRLQDETKYCNFSIHRDTPNDQWIMKNNDGKQLIAKTLHEVLRQAITYIETNRVELKGSKYSYRLQQ